MASKYTDDIIKNAVSNCYSVSEVVRYIGAGVSGSVHSHVSRRISSLNLNTEHFKPKHSVISSSRKSSEIILTELPKGSKRLPRRQLLRAMLETGISYSCLLCNINSTWNDLPINLEIDHIDGNSLNNTKNNLRFLCPNCHSQTNSNNRSKSCTPSDVMPKAWSISNGLEVTNVKGRPKDSCKCGAVKSVNSMSCRKCVPRPTKIHWPSCEELNRMVQLNNYTGTAKILGVSDNAVRKRLNSLEG